MPGSAAALLWSSDSRTNPVTSPCPQCPEPPGLVCRPAQPQKGCLAGGSAPLAHGGPASQHRQATARSFVLSSLRLGRRLGASAAGRRADPGQPLCRPCCPGQEVPASGGAGDLAQPGASQGAWRALLWSPACQPAPGAALRPVACTACISGWYGTAGMHVSSAAWAWAPMMHVGRHRQEAWAQHLYIVCLC